MYLFFKSSSSHLQRQIFIMFLTFILLILLIDAHANPFPRDSENLIDSVRSPFDTTFDTTSLSSAPHIEPVGDLSQDSIANSNPTSPHIECTSDASMDDLDENIIFKRGNSCRATTATPTMGKLKFPAWLIKFLPSLDMFSKNPKESTIKADQACNDYEGRSYLVTCGGPEVNGNLNQIPFIMNCVSGKFFIF